MDDRLAHHVEAGVENQRHARETVKLFEEEIILLVPFALDGLQSAGAILMVAELLAVIRGEDDQGVIVLPAFLQVAGHAAEMVIDLGNQWTFGPRNRAAEPTLSYEALLKDCNSHGKL